MTNEYKQFMLMCINAWGTKDQLDVAQEELAELIVALSHFARSRHNAVEEVIEELADVRLMCDQIITILDLCGFGEDEVIRIQNQKIKNVINRIAKNFPEIYETYEGDMRKLVANISVDP